MVEFHFRRLIVYGIQATRSAVYHIQCASIAIYTVGDNTKRALSSQTYLHICYPHMEMSPTHTLTTLFSL